ncbi:MAG: type II toxin-antitoxin system RelE/ParE family toxin [Desulfobulbaceae bacterium]|nr:type II toxin-antitoxin system RelE/ParE family toxin [Desulfobulbaceae bacterium]
MKVYLSSSFGKKIKKFKKKEKLALDNEIKRIIENPSVGSEKRGDLRGIFVHKFQIANILFLMSYRFVGEDIELITIGPHENYYRDLKTYLKKR